MPLSDTSLFFNLTRAVTLKVRTSTKYYLQLVELLNFHVNEREEELSLSNRDLQVKNSIRIIYKTCLKYYACNDLLVGNFYKESLLIS